MPTKTAAQLEKDHKARMRRDAAKKARAEFAKRAAAAQRVGAEDEEAKAEATTATESASSNNKVLNAGKHSRQPMRMRQAREQLAEAFDGVGGVPALIKWGKTNPTEFYRLWSKLLPKEEAATNDMPLETLLAKLAERAEMSVMQAAESIGEEAMTEAGRRVAMEDAAAGLSYVEGGGMLN